MPPGYENIKRRLKQHEQSHLLAFYEELTARQQRALLTQIDGIDFKALDELIGQYVRRPTGIALPADLAPAPYYKYAGAGSEKREGLGYDPAQYRAAGEQLIRAGKIAAFTVAGGQGTRLGWNGPKGTFPATVVTGKPLFRVFAEQILASQKRYGVTIPWYIMTSPANDAQTRAFFADNNHFNLPNPRRNIVMFPQGMLPSIDLGAGKLLLAEKWEVAMNPDGHGGSLKALCDSGALQDMQARGIAHISYFQVDNPLVRCIDPLFIGLHATAPDSSAEMSSKMVAKAAPDEKVGVFCQDASDRPGRGKTIVIEYSDLPADLAQQRDATGQLRFVAGSIAIHMLGVSFVRTLTAQRHHFALPYHRAEKSVPYVDTQSGQKVQPTSANAVKLESFVFDAIGLAESSIVYETSRVEEFAPIKNATGTDSPATSHQLQSDRHGGWLERAGVRVPHGKNGHVQAKIEINALTALEADDLQQRDVKPLLPREIAPGQQVVL